MRLLLMSCKVSAWLQGVYMALCAPVTDEVIPSKQKKFGPSTKQADRQLVT